MPVKAALMALAIGASYSASAAYTSFADAYSAYQQSLAGIDKVDIAVKARQAFELGKQEYAADSANYAALMMNYANAIAATTMSGGQSGKLCIESSQRVAEGAQPSEKLSTFDACSSEHLRQQAFELYHQALQIYQQQYGDKALETIDPLLGMAQTTELEQEKKYFSFDAINVAEKHGDALTLAATQLAAYKLLHRAKYYLHNTNKVDNLALDALKTYRNNAPANSFEVVDAELTVAKLHLEKKQYDDAEPLFQDVIKQLDVLPYSHPYALTAHALLVKLYQEADASEKATLHCKAIGQATPWDDNQQPAPLYSQAPLYPILYARQHKAGSVELAFTIDENGTVQNPQVVNVTGGERFADEAITALKQWRYAPKFENGKAVAAQSSLKLDFKLDGR
ncbi:hypothetical protein HR45_08820 [Shewanella mangrovi]|uniref:TonB C-terminal domain-containing protein n=2 Tax=Shewanella mangrovi TaxID=1515746 RepID=A0A094JIR7_9GAMM|nr:hypothetical protein HR45_08820 [Shewanella mangrovi]